MEKDKHRIDLNKKIKEAVEDETVHSFYVNGFINAYYTSDIIIVFTKNRKNEVIINMSYTLAKSLAERLTRLITAFEKRTAHEIMTTDYITGKIQESLEPKAKVDKVAQTIINKIKDTKKKKE